MKNTLMTKLQELQNLNNDNFNNDQIKQIKESIEEIKCKLFGIEIEKKIFKEIHRINFDQIIPIYNKNLDYSASSDPKTMSALTLIDTLKEKIKNKLIKKYNLNNESRNKSFELFLYIITNDINKIFESINNLEKILEK